MLDTYTKIQFKKTLLNIYFCTNLIIDGAYFYRYDHLMSIKRDFIKIQYIRGINNNYGT